MTSYFYDTEFLEDGKTIDLISIGIVCEDGREYYAVASDAPWERITAHDWLVRNVLPSLPITGRTSLNSYLKVPENSFPKPPLSVVAADMKDTRVKPRWVIANEVREFLLVATNVELWADYAAYDHVVLCQLWGAMVNLPDGLPMFTRDIQQEADRLGLTDADLPAQVEGHHNALADARAVKARFEFLATRQAAR